MMTEAARAGVFYFLIAFAAGFFLGTIRVLFLAPSIGVTASVLAELPIILAVSWFAARWLIDRQSVSPELSARATMGTVGFVLLILAEVLLGMLAFGLAFDDQIAAFGTLPGALGLAGQVVFGLIPLFIKDPNR